MTTLRYRGFEVAPEDLAIGECTVRPTRAPNGGALYWRLWFLAARETDGVPEMFGVPLNPNGAYTENAPGGKTWGLTKTSPGTWQIAPSINVLESRVLHPGEHPTEVSVWHQTPAIVGVPDGEPWQAGPPAP